MINDCTHLQLKYLKALFYYAKRGYYLESIVLSKFSIFLQQADISS